MKLRGLTKHTLWWPRPTPTIFFPGVSSERRTKEIKRLNQTYLNVIDEEKGLDESLAHMVQTESYRWICKATYSLDPQPLRSQRIYEAERTEVQDSVYFII